MKTLRRILTSIFACILVFSCVPFGAVAETDCGVLLDTTLTEYYERSDAHMEHGYFPEGELPCMAYIFMQVNLKSGGMFFADYCITTKVNGYNKYTYEIPGDVFEKAVFEIFSETDATIAVLRGGQEYMTDREEPYYRIEGADLDLDGSDEYEIEYAGYREREDGAAEVWLYVAGGVPENSTKLVAKASKVTDFSSRTNYGIGFRYGSLRVRYAVKSIADIKDGVVTIRSFEKADVADVPGDLKEYNVPDKIEMDGAFMHTTVDPFGVGTEVYCNHSRLNGSVAKNAKEVLNGVEKAISVYKFTAIARGEKVQPSSPVTVEFMIPYSFRTDVRVYRINEKNEYELIPSAVNEESRTVTAVIDDFSFTYVVGGKCEAGSGDANSDGKINLQDASLVLKHIAKWNGLEVDAPVADVNSDGRVNLTDVSAILKYVAGWSYPIAPAPSSK